MKIKEHKVKIRDLVAGYSDDDAKYTDIPCDYEGLMGVPLTFLDKY